MVSESVQTSTARCSESRQQKIASHPLDMRLSIHFKSLFDVMINTCTDCGSICDMRHPSGSLGHPISVVASQPYVLLNCITLNFNQYQRSQVANECKLRAKLITAATHISGIRMSSFSWSYESVGVAGVWIETDPILWIKPLKPWGITLKTSLFVPKVTLQADSLLISLEMRCVYLGFWLSGGKRGLYFGET